MVHLFFQPPFANSQRIFGTFSLIILTVWDDRCQVRYPSRGSPSRFVWLSLAFDSAAMENEFVLRSGGWGVICARIGQAVGIV